MGGPVMNAFDGQKVNMQISTREPTTSAVISENMIDDVEVILGMDVIDVLGRVTATGNTIQFDKIGGDILPTCSLLTEADDSLNEKIHFSDRDFFSGF